MRVAFNSPARNQVWESRSTGGPLACNQQMGVRFPPLPPIVTVAEWLRRQTVDLSTRVQFPPVTPCMRASFNGKDTSVLTKKRRFDSGRLFQVCGRSSVGFRARVSGTRGRWFDPSRSLQILQFG